MGFSTVNLTFNDSSDRTLVGITTYDRASGGTLVVPAGVAFPVTPVAGELFWRSDESKLYRRDTGNTTWDPVIAGFSVVGQTQGDVLYFDGATWTRLPAGTSGQFLKTLGAGFDPAWDAAAALTGAAPDNVTKAAAAVGVATTAARADHKHDITTAPAVAVGTANGEGSGTALARSDHTHQVTGFAISGQVQGDVLYFNGAAWVRLPPGTSGQFLQTLGAAADPAWASAASLTASAPADVTKAAAAVGVATSAARADHKHDITTAAPSATGVATASADGVATTLARSDHAHQSNTAPSDVTKAAAAIGTSGQPARADHKHDITTAVASAQVPGDAAAEGVATSLARSDHKHSLPAYGAVAATIAQGDDARFTDDRTASGLRTATTIVAISAAAAPSVGQILKATSDTAATWQAESGGAPLTNTAPVDVTKAAAAVGVSSEAARGDHKHDISTAAAVAVGTANAEGAATSLARSDHTHQVTGLTIAGQVQGDVLYFNGASWVRLAPGIAGQKLQTNGAAANPTWATVAGGGDVTAALNLTDNAVILGDGGAKGVKSSAKWSQNGNNLRAIAGDASITNIRNVRFSGEFDNGNGGAAKTIDWNNGQKQKITLTGATCVLTLTALTDGVANVLLKLVQDATGTRTVTWPASVKWRFGVAAILTTTPLGIDIVSLYFDGTDYFAVSTLSFQ